MKKHLVAIVAVFGSILAPVAANAAVATEVTDAFTALETDIGTYIGLATSAALVFALGWLGIRLMKTFIRRAF